MKKEFSFYEFVGIIVPSVTLMFFSSFFIELTWGKTLVDFSRIGESLVFFIIAYGIGHILHAIGNIYELLIWSVLGGWPGTWLTKKPRLGQRLFDSEQTKNIKEKIEKRYGNDHKKDYSKYLYNYLFSLQKTARIDIFNGNYSLFRGLSISFFLIGLMCLN